MSASVPPSPLLLPPPSPPPSVDGRPLWHRSAASGSAALVLRSSAFRPSSVSLSPSAAVSLRAMLRATSARPQTEERACIELSARLHADDGRQQQLAVDITNAAEVDDGREEEAGHAAADDDAALFAVGGSSDRLSIAVKRRLVSTVQEEQPSQLWSTADYSAELDELTRRMDRHRFQPAMQHYIRAFGALLDTTSRPQQQQQLHIECLLPSLSLRLTSLLPSAITLQPSSLLHSLLSHGLSSTSLSSSSFGYLTLTVRHQVRLVHLPSDVLSLPLLGVYSCSPPSSHSTFVQCVHFLYSRAISRLTVAPLTFLLLSLHQQRAELYEVSATMDAVAVEHCAADIALSISSPQPLTAPLQSLSANRRRELWGDTDSSESSSHPPMDASTATTATDATTAHSASSAMCGGRDRQTWSGVYSDGEGELGDGQWPPSPLSLRSPSPLPVAPPRPYQRLHVHATRCSCKAGAARRDGQRRDNVPKGKENVATIPHSDRAEAHVGPTAAGHPSQAYDAAVCRGTAVTAAETKKRQLQAVSVRMRQRRVTEIAARKQAAAAAAAAAERRTVAGSGRAAQRGTLQSRNAASADKRHSKADQHSNTATLKLTAQRQQTSDDSSDHSHRLHPPVEHNAPTELQPAIPQQRLAVRDVIVRVDDTRSECETEERKRSIQRCRQQRMERKHAQQQQRPMRLSEAHQTDSWQPSTASPAAPSSTQTATAATPYQSTPVTPSPFASESLDLFSLLRSHSVQSALASPFPASAAPAPLDAALHLLRLIVEAAQRLQPQPAGGTSERSTADEQQAQPAAACAPPSRAPQQASGQPREHTAMEAEQRRRVSAKAETATAEKSDSLSPRGKLTAEHAAAVTDVDAPSTSQPPSPAARQQPDGTMGQEAVNDRPETQLCTDTVLTLDGDVLRGWQNEEEKYPLTPLSLPLREQQHTPTAIRDDEYRWEQSQQLSLPTTSTRSPSQSLSASDSISDLSEGSSSDEWRTAPITLSSSQRLLLLSWSDRSSLSQQSAIAPPSPSASSLCSLDALSIPRINATGVAASMPHRRHSDGNEEEEDDDDDDDDDEDEAVLSKYEPKNVGKSRMGRHRSRG